MNVYGDPAEPVELGASIFVQVNENLVNAAAEFGLRYSDEMSSASRPLEADADVLGIYNGKEMVFSFPESNWWGLAKLAIRYGPLAPWRTKKLTDSTVGKFLQMYKAPLFPFASLSDVVERADLLGATGLTGEQYLAENGITGGFAQELIQASTRVNYGQNLGLIHGLETMVCMAADGAMAIADGNWRIFDGMVKASNAQARLNTTVKSIARSDSTGKWTVTSKGADATEDTSIYDVVVLAAPLQFTGGLTITPALESPPDKIPYATLHVTLFTSPLRLSPGAFGVRGNTPMPATILTTLTPDEQADPSTVRGEGKAGVGAVGFFSISTLRSTLREMPNGTSRVEYLYKVFSPERFSDSKVLTILGVTGTEPADDVIGWSYRHIWKAYPYEYPRVTFDEIKLADGLFYTSGIESFISTMETSSLMGMNVAKLIVDEWEEKEGSAGKARPVAEPVETESSSLKTDL